MVAVALDHALQQAKMLIVDAHQAVLLNDEDALTVANVEHRWRHGIMRRTISIAAELFDLLDTPCLQSIGDGRTYAGMILMQVHALQFHLLTV